MLGNTSLLHIVRAGSDITYSSLKVIGSRILNAFPGSIMEFKLARHNAPVVDSIDAYFLTKILHQEFGGHVLGITDADLTTYSDNDFYNSIFGGKNPQNDVAVVSTKKLYMDRIDSKKAYELFLDRTSKVSLHEVGHNLGLTDHATYRTAPDGSLCPMSRGEYNKFGYVGYLRAIIDGRGLNFCDECMHFLSRIYIRRQQRLKLAKDGLVTKSLPSAERGFERHNTARGAIIDVPTHVTASVPSR
jgi:predicted Zn-dependent protease